MLIRYLAPSLVLSLTLLPRSSNAKPLPDFYDESATRLPPSLNPPDTDTLDVELVDVDGDGDLDLFVVEGTASPAPRPNFLYINDGTGVFSDQSLLRLPAGAPANSSEVDASDVDGDGDIDLYLGNLGPNRLLLNDGNGFFSDASATHLPPAPQNFLLDITAEAVFADVDGDGDDDLLLSNENPFNPDPMGGAQNLVLINDGTGHFVDDSATRVPARTDQTAGQVPGDIDGDGDLDVMVINIGANAVLINDGTGHFTDQTATRMAGGLPLSSRKGAVGDIDGDGCLDLVVANSRAQANELWLNDCTGVFTDDSARMPTNANTSTDVDLVDLDGDGDLDVFFTNAGTFLFGHGFLGEGNVVYRNDQPANKLKDKTHQSFPAVSNPSTNAEFGDVDGDGDVDLVVGNSTESNGAERLWIND
ncbi:MAG: VCBS repeat-containing protein [Deltaproteobacteria bacterium]|nr:VCBS repeat-containing protein [Deltaproteobacteria bacterium]